MNDTTELTHALPMAKSVVESFLESSVDPVVHKTLQSLVSAEFATGFLAQVHSQYFLMCFSTLSDDLPQWRSYAADASGVCIAFDLRELRPPEDLDTMVTFAPCVYDDVEKSRLLRSLVTDFISRHAAIGDICDDPIEMAFQWANWQINNPTKPLSDFKSSFVRSLAVESVTKFRIDFVRLCCHFKSHHFISEQEWRLVLPHQKNKSFRTTTAGEVNGKPYVNFLFEGSECLPITSVKLGSGADEHTVRTILSDTGYDVSVTRSAIPYRGARQGV